MMGDLLATGSSSDVAWLADRSSGPMASGSVLVHAPSNAFQAPGGGENQLIRTSRSLEDLGLIIRPFSPWVDRLGDARLLHLFGMSREGLELARVARARGVPVVLSPICWYEPRSLAALASSRTKAALDLSKWAARRLAPRLPDWRRELLSLSAAILPNSSAEARQLARLFGADRDTIHVVPNGVDPRFALADAGPFRALHGDADFVLYVGRIEPRKNVLGLIRSARVADLPLVVIGATVPGHEAYASSCRRAATDSTTFLGPLDHADPLLSSAMARARVFALPSWFETPGLAALEAAMAGCAIAITPYGCTREYFGDRVEYASPDCIQSLALALRRAWDNGPPSTLKAHVAANFAWSSAAIATGEAYERVS